MLLLFPHILYTENALKTDVLTPFSFRSARYNAHSDMIEALSSTHSITRLKTRATNTKPFLSCESRQRKKHRCVTINHQTYNDMNLLCINGTKSGLISVYTSQWSHRHLFSETSVSYDAKTPDSLETASRRPVAAVSCDTDLCGKGLFPWELQPPLNFLIRPELAPNSSQDHRW